MSSEFELIDKLKKWVPTSGPGVVLGIGDDCAVLDNPPGKTLVTVDSQVEGVHFRWDWSTPEQVGHKALAVNLSDIAAMGGVPKYALVSLGLPSGFDESRIEGLYRGLGNLAKESGVVVIGGNVSKALSFFVDITVIGNAGEKYLTRSGAKAGDLVFVTGKVGESAAGFDCLKKFGKEALEKFPGLCRRHLEPRPHLQEAKWLQDQVGVTSLIDISDGLSSELFHLAKASNVGFEIVGEAFPLGNEMAQAGELLQKSCLDWQLHGGEGYELLGTAPLEVFNALQISFAKQNREFFKLGSVMEGKEVRLKTRASVQALTPKGWDHLKAL